MEANGAAARTPPSEMLHLMWARKFRAPFSLLVALHILLGWSGFTHLALNSVKIFAGQGEEALPLGGHWTSFLVSLIKVICLSFIVR